MISRFRILSPLFIISFFVSGSSAQTCVPNLPSNITLSWNALVSPEINFNNARRLEESLRGVATNSLGDMAIPSGGWASLSDDQMALYIHNSERVARGCKPFYGVENGLSVISQAHSDWQVTNNVFSHTGSSAYGTGGTYTVCPLPATTLNGSTMSQRINYTTSSVKNCYESAAESVSIRLSTSTSSASLNYPVASALFEWIYRDGGGSMWGHRINVLKTYTDNYGGTDSEGFIGVGVTSQLTGVPYAYFKVSDGTCTNYAGVRITTINYYDPQAAPSCSFSFSTTLPVELLSFDAQKSKSFVELNWETASERNSDYFLVERSPDGSSFETIGQVSAAGNTQSVMTYSFQDKSPLAGMNYYRLRQLDLDGSENLSKIISIQNGIVSHAQLFPNPANDYFVLVTGSADETDAIIEVRNSTGNMVYERRETLSNNNTVRVSTDFLSPGVYWVTVIRDNYTSETLRLVKL